MPEKRTATLHISMPEHDRLEILAWAEREDRTASNLISRIIRQAIAERDASESVQHAVSSKGLSVKRNPAGANPTK
jgi:hypothetical protein